MTAHRRERLSGELRDEIAQIVSRGLKDPRIGFVTVTRVELSADLSHAKAFVSVLGSEDQRRESLAGLKRATGFVRREVGRRIRMRVLPEIHFVYDKGLDATDRVAQLLEQVRPRDDGEGED